MRGELRSPGGAAFLRWGKDIVRRNSALWMVAVVLVAAGGSPAQWTAVGDGIDYREYRLSNPDNDAFVTRMDVANTNTIIESTIAEDRVYGAREVVSSQAARQDDAISAWGSGWGQRNNVVAAVNGSFFNLTSGVITGGHIFSGWHAKRFDQFSGQTGFAWKRDRSYFIGGCPYIKPNQQLITWVSGGATQEINGVNVARLSNELILYTPQYDYYTHTDNSGHEVLVQMDAPAMVSSIGILGTVREVRSNQGSSTIPFDYVVLSGAGTAGQTLLSHAQVGARVRISQVVKHYYIDCNTPFPDSFDNTFALAQGNHVFLRDSQIIPKDDPGYTNRNPRTAVGFNSSYVFFIVVDGRSARSAGMSITELGAFARDTLGATDAVNMDGGGSSTMVVNGEVKNVPSDGSERTVANGLMMVNLSPKVQSTTFNGGQTITTAATASYRLGPGTNYHALGTINAGSSATILSHALDGVFAKGDSWWNCDVGGLRGWMPESALSGVPVEVPPTITQHPVSRSIVLGDGLTFSVQAQGTAPLNYVWQRNQVDLADGGAYSGVFTPTLTITQASTPQIGAYRCVVTNNAGSATSSEATLTLLRSPDFDVDGDCDVSDFAHLQLCLGTFSLVDEPSCADADLDNDELVNYRDLPVFLGCFTAPGVPIVPTCLTAQP